MIIVPVKDGENIEKELSRNLKESLKKQAS